MTKILFISGLVLSVSSIFSPVAGMVGVGLLGISFLKWGEKELEK